MIFVGDGVSVMVVGFFVRSLLGVIKMLGRLFIVLLFLIIVKWKYKNVNYGRMDKYIIVIFYSGIFICNE